MCVGLPLMDQGVPAGEAVVLEPAQLRTLLRKSFNLGMDPDPRKPRALNRLELAKALVGVAEANAAAAKAIAIERAIETEAIANSEVFALHAAAFNGMPDPVFHLMERTMGIITGLAQVEPDPRAGDEDRLLNIAMLAASGLAKLLQARHGFTTATTNPQRDAVTSALIDAGEQLRKAGEEITAFFKLAEASWAAGRRGHSDLN